MDEPKPLSKDRLAEIRRKHSLHEIPSGALIAVRELLAAEQFWREAVTNALNQFEGDEGPFCRFCIAELWVGTSDTPSKFMHQADCPWLLAQSE